MKDAAELCRGLLRKSKSDRIAMEYDDSFWPSQQVAQEARSSALAVLRFVLDRLPADIRKAAD